MTQKGFISSSVLIAIIVGVTIIGGGYFVTQKVLDSPNNADETGEEMQRENIITGVGIVTEKDTYQTHEPFENAFYTLSYEGSPFEGVVVYGHSREGFEDKSTYSRTVGTIREGDFSDNSLLRTVPQAFSIDETGYTCCTSSFQEAGEYSFTISIYACSDIGTENCEDISAEDVVRDHTPLSSASAMVTVVNGQTAENMNDSSETNQEYAEDTVLSCIEYIDTDQERYADCTLGFLELFEERLKSCVTSRGTAAVGLEPALGLYRGYDILGEDNNICSVKFWFLETENIPPALLNKEMTCEYEPAELTVDTVAALDKCSGPLVGEIEEITSGW